MPSKKSITPYFIYVYICIYNIYTCMCVHICIYAHIYIFVYTKHLRISKER